MELYPYQREGVKEAIRLITHGPQHAAMIGDEMGLGKTAQAITIANQLNACDILIICPASLKYNWQNEVVLWTDRPTISYVVRDGKATIPDGLNYTIVNYDLLLRDNIFSQLQERKYDLIIMDEAHCLRNRNAKRTKRVLLGKDALVRRSRAKLALTGTPVLNRPVELWPIVASLCPDALGKYTSYWDYARRYCAAYQGRFGWDVSGSSNKKELATNLRQHFMIRRLKRHVLTELPEKTLQIIPLQIDSTGNFVKNEHKTLGEETLKKLKFGELNVNIGDIAEWRQSVALAKLQKSVEHLKEILEGGVEKVVVFAWHRAVIDALHAELHSYKPVVITGGTKNEDRQEAVTAFQTDGSVRVFIGSIAAAGTGITLTAASTVIFVENSWIPGDVQQAIDRCHRIGQRDAVLAQFLVVKDSIEEHIMKTLLDKQKVIDSIIDKEEVSHDANS